MLRDAGSVLRDVGSMLRIFGGLLRNFKALVFGTECWVALAGTYCAETDALSLVCRGRRKLCVCRDRREHRK